MPTTTTKRKPTTKTTTSKKPAKKDLVARRNEYAAKFFPYIEKVARRLARRLPAHVEIDDLISSGVIGLMEAAERFDPNRVDRFEAFAEFRIRGAMLDDLRSRDTLSRDMRRLSNELRDATRRLESQLGRTPDHEEIAKRLGVGVEELYARQQKLSGSSVVGIDDAGPDLLERTGDASADDPFELASRREMLERLVGGIRRPLRVLDGLLGRGEVGLSGRDGFFGRRERDQRLALVAVDLLEAIELVAGNCGLACHV